MATIVTRAGKGSPLTSSELDQNQINLNTDKAELSGAVFTGAITTNSTIDGRDVAADGVTADAALPKSGGTLTGTLSLGDNVKAQFGASNDLQIYHDANDSYIKDQGSGNLKLLTDEFRVRNAADSAHMITSSQSGAVTLYHDNSPTLATTSSGISVTGSVVADVSTKTPFISLGSTTNSYQTVTGSSDGNDLTYRAYQNHVFKNVTGASSSTDGTDRLKIASNGDISFYNDSGNAKFFWDASAEDLQIGGNLLNLSGVSSGTTGARLNANGGGMLRLASGGVDALYVVDGGNVGIGVVPSSPLHVNVGTNQNLEIDSAGSELRLSAVNDARSANPAIRFQAESYKFYGSGGVGPRATIDSSGYVGINQSSPSSYYAKNLVVGAATEGGITIASNATTAWAYLMFADGTSGDNAYSGYLGHNHATDNLVLSTKGTLSFGSGGATRLNIDSSGNVGIGVSPSTKLHVLGGRSTFYSGDNYAVGVGNASGVLGGYMGSPAVNVLSFSEPGGIERMRIDSGGNVGIGVTNVGAPLDIGSASPKIRLTDTGGGYSELRGNGGVMTLTADAGNTVANSAVTFETDGTERMRIDSSGNVGIGCSPLSLLQLAKASMPSSITRANNYLQIGGSEERLNGYQVIGFGYNDSGRTHMPAYIGFQQTVLSSGNAGDLIFGTRPDGSDVVPTERARLTKDGNFLVGATSGSNHIIQKSNASAVVLQIINSSATSPAGAAFTFSAAAPNNGTSTFFTTSDTGGYRGGWLSNGGVQNYQGNNSNLSDRREKTNFAPAKAYLDTICGIPVQTFNYIDQNMEDDGGLTLGVVAQDVQATAPELVVESNWGTEDEPKMRLSIYQTDLQYALMKCIQEQQTLIESLTDRIAALEE